MRFGSCVNSRSRIPPAFCDLLPVGHRRVMASRSSNQIQPVVGPRRPAALTVTAGAAMAGNKVHRLALQISDNDNDKMDGRAACRSEHSDALCRQGGRGRDQDCRLQRWPPHAPNRYVFCRERIAGFAKSMPNVAFHACGNTIEGMIKKEGRSRPSLRTRRSFRLGSHDISPMLRSETVQDFTPPCV